MIRPTQRRPKSPERRNLIIPPASADENNNNNNSKTKLRGSGGGGSQRTKHFFLALLCGLLALTVLGFFLLLVATASETETLIPAPPKTTTAATLKDPKTTRKVVLKDKHKNQPRRKEQVKVNNNKSEAIVERLQNNFVVQQGKEEPDSEPNDTPTAIVKSETEIKELLHLDSKAVLVPCARRASRSDDENNRIRDECYDSANGKEKVAYYNPYERDRFVCNGKVKIPSGQAILLDVHGASCSSTVPTLFPTDPDLHRDQMPPITLHFNSKTGTNARPFEGCDVPCLETGHPSINCIRYVEGTDWQFTHSMEGPQYYANLYRQPDAWKRNQFYATTSFESEIPLPYYSAADFRIQAPAVEFDEVIAGAAFMARNCNSRNDREALVRFLIGSKFRTDSLSGCLHNADPPPGVNLHGPKEPIMKRYMFYLAFENQSENDYITEKLWGPYQAGVVPVYYGSPNIKEHVPEHSLIFVDDFATHQDLADYLIRVSRDKDLYNSYHAWRKQPLPPHFRLKYDITDTHSTCRFCRWSYARMYGTGWNHTTQSIQPLRAGSRRVCLDKKGGLRQPFRELWSDSDSPLRTEFVAGRHRNGSKDDDAEARCRLDDTNRVIQASDGPNRFRRTVYNHDGVVDMVIETFGNHHDLVLSIETGLKGAGDLKSWRNGVWYLQNRLSRFTIVSANAPSGQLPPKSSQPGSVEIAIQARELRLRMFVEDIDTFHEGADEVENYFGQIMVHDFLQPVQMYLVED